MKHCPHCGGDISMLFMPAKRRGSSKAVEVLDEMTPEIEKKMNQPGVIKRVIKKFGL